MRIRELTGMPSLYSNDVWFAQIVSVRLLVETDIVALKKHLYDDGRIEVPLIEWNGNKLIRIPIQGYATLKDVDRLVSALSTRLSG